ncbi:glycosyltransferase involved in cell wall biosynthesis [Spiribacter vilamensis]|uniref:Glycosyltransferase involved in cell wall biosynthesis n=2 Tax=Spiribacter vilamensis TaxID=531306 RepID=A0A4Q8D212_9GAMM|nr:glycosyltransferase family 4 protein [Spiribacter vilamensis]RZU99409.1 glycosyltransferase involved in cell wall biosynthesis [Spiribacter vilamensis]
MRQRAVKVAEATPRVLHINVARGWRGGEQQTWLLMRELAARGYRQGLCAYPDEPLAKAALDLEGVVTFSPRQCLRRPWTIGNWGISHVHDGRGIYWAWWLKKLRGIRYVVTRRMQQAPKDRFLTRLAYHQADALVAISSAARDGLQSFCPGHEVFLIPSAHSGLTPTRSATPAIRDHLMTDPANILIGNAGALRDSDKGQTILIQAGEQLRAAGYPVELVFFGEGEDRAVLERAAQGLKWIHFPGHVTPIEDYLGALDVFAFPSRHEGLGSVLLEAMTAEVPIVASQVGGIPDIVTDSVSGLLVEPETADALATAISKVIDTPDLALKFSTEGRRVAESMGPERMVEKYICVYDSLVASARE